MGEHPRRIVTRAQQVSKHAPKTEAQIAGRIFAIRDKVEHLVHKKDGTIGIRNSYGGDSARRPG